MKFLKTPWSDSANACEYPRPQMQRREWQSLDGEWDCAFVNDNIASVRAEDVIFDKKIRVPFSPESPLSGINRLTTPSETLVYRTTFLRKEKDKIALLHFGAVDYECKIFINGAYVGGHIGGYTPFELDATDFLKDVNELRVLVSDPSDTQPISRGKQKTKNGGIWYTPTSGIWQSVWLEYLPKTYIKSLRIKPDLDSLSVDIQ